MDEYGGVTGLVTIEDLLECIFGELPSASETSVAGELSRRVNDADNLHASMTVETFNLGLGASLPTEIAKSIGGLILHEYGEMPSEGSKVTVGGWELTVVSVEKNRIREVRVKELASKQTNHVRVTGQPVDGEPQSGQTGETGGIATAAESLVVKQNESAPEETNKQQGEG